MRITLIHEKNVRLSVSTHVLYNQTQVLLGNSIQTKMAEVNGPAAESK